MTVAVDLQFFIVDHATGVGRHVSVLGSLLYGQGEISSALNRTVHDIGVITTDWRVEVDSIGVVPSEFAAGCDNAAKVRAGRVLLEVSHQGSLQDMHECAVGTDDIFR